MAAIHLTLKIDQISPKLKKCFSLDTTPVMRAMGTTFKSITEGNFNSVGSALRPAVWKAKRDGTPAILQLSTTMAKAFQLTVAARSATVTNPVPYAAIHQFGGTIKGNPWLRFQWAPGKWATVRQVVIPARPFYPVLNGKLTPAAETLINKAGHRAAARLLSIGEHEQ